MPAAGNQQTAARLAGLGLSLPASPQPLGRYVPASREGSLLFLSGMLPLVNGRLTAAGRIGDELSVEEAKRLAQIAALNALATAASWSGGLERVIRPIRLGVFMVTPAGFGAHASVADGASDLFAELFEAGHARYVAGACSLALQSPLMLDVVFEVG